MNPMFGDYVGELSKDQLHGVVAGASVMGAAAKFALRRESSPTAAMGAGFVTGSPRPRMFGGGGNAPASSGGCGPFGCST